MPTSGTTPRMRPMIPLTGSFCLSVCFSVCLSVSYLLSLSHFCLYMRFSVGCVCACARESSRACVAVCCSVLQCVAVCRSVSQCVAVCRSVSQCAASFYSCRCAQLCMCVRARVVKSMCRVVALWFVWGAYTV